MSRLRGVLELGVSGDLVLSAGRQVFAELGWEVIAEDGRVLTAREDATRLCCHQSPAETTLRAGEIEGDSAAVVIETRVPGFGPISASHARDRQAAIVRLVHARVTV